MYFTPVTDMLSTAMSSYHLFHAVLENPDCCNNKKSIPIFLIRILIINLQGTPLLPAVTSPSSSPLATSYTASWTTYSISPVLEYELAYKNKWDRVSISRNMPQYKCEWL